MISDPVTNVPYIFSPNKLHWFSKSNVLTYVMTYKQMYWSVHGHFYCVLYKEVKVSTI
jgi:hypothetical protein